MRISDWSSDVCSSDLLVQPAVSVVPSAAQAKLRDLTQRRVQLVNMRVAEINRSHQASPALAASHRRVQAALTREITHIERDIQRCLASADASALKATVDLLSKTPGIRSEERRVGKGGVSNGKSRWS